MIQLYVPKRSYNEPEVWCVVDMNVHEPSLLMTLCSRLVPSGSQRTVPSGPICPVCKAKQK